MFFIPIPNTLVPRRTTPQRSVLRNQAIKQRLAIHHLLTTLSAVLAVPVAVFASSSSSSPFFNERDIDGNDGHSKRHTARILRFPGVIANRTSQGYGGRTGQCLCTCG
jgi:hypothetical protein